MWENYASGVECRVEVEEVVREVEEKRLYQWKSRLVLCPYATVRIIQGEWDIHLISSSSSNNLYNSYKIISISFLVIQSFSNNILPTNLWGFLEKSSSACSAMA